MMENRELLATIAGSVLVGYTVLYQLYKAFPVIFSLGMAESNKSLEENLRRPDDYLLFTLTFMVSPLVALVVVRVGQYSPAPITLAEADRLSFYHVIFSWGIC